MDLTTALIGIGIGIVTQIFQLINAFTSRKKVKSAIDDANTDLQAKLHAMDAKIDSVAKEVKDNGGNGLKDVCRKTSGDVAKLFSMVTEQAEIQNANATIFMNESIQEPAFRLDRHGNCTFANERLVEFVGLPYNEITGRGFLKVIGRTQDERLSFQNTLIDSIEGGVPFVCDTYVKNYDTGIARPCEVKLQSFPSKGDQTSILFFYGKIKEKTA